MEQPLPVSLVTGFLGSGKTTFIRRVLTEPGFARTAVIVNEFGEVALDHDLIASSDESVLTLGTGCLCCAVQTDLARTLLDLAERRERGTAAFDRVLIETSGLGNPAPMLQSLLTDRDVAARHRVDRVVTIADAVHGTRALAAHPEARAQVTMADTILISKQDVQPMPPALRDALRALNPAAPVLAVAEAGAEALFGGPRIGGRLPRHAHAGTARHGGIATVSLVRERPVPALALALFLQALAEHCGPRLLRMKGIVALREAPERPAEIHGVHHVVSAPEFLPRWPRGDRSTRMVFIGEGIPRWFVHRLLAAIEEEVRDAGG